MTKADTDGWRFPLTRLDGALPKWIQLGGDFRNRAESQHGIGFALGNNFYNLSLVAGRQMLSFGDERVIRPSEWNNVGHTLDTVRLDVHHTGVSVSVFAASVVLVRDGVVDHHLQGPLRLHDLRALS